MSNMDQFITTKPQPYLPQASQFSSLHVHYSTIFAPTYSCFSLQWIPGQTPVEGPKSSPWQQLWEDPEQLRPYGVPSAERRAQHWVQEHGKILLWYITQHWVQNHGKILLWYFTQRRVQKHGKILLWCYTQHWVQKHGKILL